jgi:hypothetical protein
MWTIILRKLGWNMSIKSSAVVYVIEHQAVYWFLAWHILPNTNVTKYCCPQINVIEKIANSQLIPEFLQILCFWTLSIVLFLFKKQRFGDWILSPSSGKTYLVWLRRKGVALSLEPNWVGFTWNVVFLNKRGRYFGYFFLIRIVGGGTGSTRHVGHWMA